MDWRAILSKEAVIFVILSVQRIFSRIRNIATCDNSIPKRYKEYLMLQEEIRRQKSIYVTI
jgi:hypothetical protein